MKKHTDIARNTARAIGRSGIRENSESEFSRIRLRGAIMIALLVVWFQAPIASAAEPTTFSDVVASVQPKMVKIYGAGGLRGLEAYQSGFLISPQGHVLTAWSYVLDTDFITVTLADGRKFQGRLVGADPRIEIAILKIPVEEVPYFSLDQAQPLDVGDRVLAFSNLFGVAMGDEPASVQHGNVSIKTSLSARRGAFETPYDGPVYVLDAMTNNPGAAGGVLTNLRGELAGILGKELRNTLNNTWLNHAVPIDAITASVEGILAGKILPRSVEDETRKPAQPWTLSQLGIRLVPNVLPKTPPFLDAVTTGSPAAKAGLQPDDLILFVNGRVASSCKNLADELTFIDRIDPVSLTVQRGIDLLEITLDPEP
jgi:S1-C subfamily serine protease